VFIVWQQHWLRLRGKGRRALVVLCLSLACSGTPAWAAAGQVDGISDQGLASWAGSLPSQDIKLARYVVQWNVMQGAGYPEELANLQRWYDQALALQLTPELALDNYNCDSCSAIAGDLLDSEPNMVTYERSYERELTPADPGNWAIHPYHAVKYMTDSTVTSFRNALPSPATDRIWFTEVGAYYCEAGRTYGERSQASEAQFLVDKLIPEFQPAHVFYYELATGPDEPPACDSEQDDTALYATSDPSGAVRARAAAHVIFAPTPILTAGLEELFAG
jgi:hypothetical protein